jgi:hypothetical protein
MGHIMLGPIGPIASNFLRSRGFIISRPTEIENTFTRSFWKDWFSTDIRLFASVYERNRATLGGINNWVSDESLAGSLSWQLRNEASHGNVLIILLNCFPSLPAGLDAFGSSTILA